MLSQPYKYIKNCRDSASESRQRTKFIRSDLLWKRSPSIRRLTDIELLVVEATEDICVNLLPGLYLSNVFICHEVAVHKCVGLLLALPVYSVVTICEPVKECVCSVVRIVL